MNKYINLLVGMLSYFIPAIIFKYIIGSNEAMWLWLAVGWVFSLFVLDYLDGNL